MESGKQILRPSLQPRQAALVAVGLTPVYTLLWTRQPALALATLLIAAILTWRHRENIARLRAGTESRIGRKKTAPSTP